MDEKTLEILAKEYKTALSSPPAADTIDRIVNLEEEQMDCLNEVAFRSPGRVNRTVSYLRSLTYRTMSLLAAVKKETYLPSVRSRCGNSAPLNRFAALQVDIFVLFDTMPTDPAIFEILSLENRKAALIGGLL